MGLVAANLRHIVIDMQRIFAEETVWHTPVMAEILPNILELCEAYAGVTLFAKFMVPAAPEQAPGSWEAYYRRWSMLTTEQMDPAMQDLIAPLAAIAPERAVVEKTTYSIFKVAGFADTLRHQDVDTIVFSGVETDICVLASAFDAVDAGFHVIIATDAVGSSSHQSHQAILTHVLPRMPDQIELATTASLMARARGGEPLANL
jgi:nicotinamidase-related amidase